MSAITDRLDTEYVAPSDTVRIVFDGTVLDRVTKLKRDILRQEALEKVNDPGLKSKVPDLEKQLAEAVEAVKAKTIVIKLQGIPREDFEELERRCPPTVEQLATYKVEAESNPMYARPPPFDVSKFAPLLIAACGVDLEPGDAEALWDRLPTAEAARLYEAALNLNWTVPYDPKSFENGIGTTSNIAPS